MISRVPCRKYPIDYRSKPVDLHSGKLRTGFSKVAFSGPRTRPDTPLEAHWAKELLVRRLGHLRLATEVPTEGWSSHLTVTELGSGAADWKGLNVWGRAGMSDERAINLNIIDDEDLIRNSLATVLRVADYHVETFSSGYEYIKALPGLNPDCVIIDVRMPKMNGLDVLDVVKQHKQNTPVIMISGYGDIAMAVKAIQTGAADFIEKPVDPEAVLKVVERACGSARKKSDAEPNDVEFEAALSNLTNREAEVLTLLVKGDQNKVVARKLGISPRTVEVHRSRIMQRLGAKSFAELVRMTVLGGFNSE